MHRCTKRPHYHLGNFRFLTPGWWVIHIISIVLLIAVGYAWNEQ